MRSLIGKRYSYIYNHFADGKNQFYDGKYPGGRSLKAMERAAETDPKIRERLHFMYYRTKEEVYDLERDPNALTNLVDSPTLREDLGTLRKQMADVLRKNGDPFEEAYQKYLRKTTAN